MIGHRGKHMIKYYCDRCGSECNGRFIVEIAKDGAEFQHEHFDLCETCKTGLNLYLKRYGNYETKNGRITKGE